jgi:hypothetical protein
MPWKPGDPRHPRRGNGAGYGGPAKGEGHRFTAGDPLAGRPAGVKDGEGKRARSAEMCAPLVADAVQVWREVMADAAAPPAARIAAAEKIIARAEGATPQRVEIADSRDLATLTDAELEAIVRGGAPSVGEATH